MKTTQGVIAKYTELYDISTDIGKNVHYKIHTPTGISHMKKLAGFYKQFKEYKYLGAQIAWVPITTLPKDPLGVGYEAGDQADPRDLINPILHKGYKGEALITDYLSERALWSENSDATDEGFQGDNKPPGKIRRMTESGGASIVGPAGTEANITTIEDWLRGMYYTSLTDAEWEKSHPREGFYKELFAVVRTLAATGRIGPTGVPQAMAKQTDPEKYKETDRDIERLGTIATNTDNNDTGIGSNLPNVGTNIQGTTEYNTPNYYGVNQTDIFTHEFERLGWMETSGKGYLLATAKDSKKAGKNWIGPGMTDLDLNRMPKVYMYLVQTPPAYKQRQYYRMSITHHFAFRKFRQVYGIDMPNIWSDESYERYGGGLIQKIAGAKMYDKTGTLHDSDFEIPKYEPALENTIEADGDGTRIEKISDGVA